MPPSTNIKKETAKAATQLVTLDKTYKAEGYTLDKDHILVR